MITKRLLYLDTQRLKAYAWRQGKLSPEGVFEMRSEDYPRFTAYLRSYPNCQFRLLVNVAEEGHELETIPFLQGTDREALITRKLSQHFLGTALATVTSLGFEKDRRTNERLVLSALTNPSHFAPWLKSITEADAALSGIYTVAQLGGMLLKKLQSPAQHCLLFSLQDHAIREIYLVNGQTHFSRMVPLNDSSISNLASHFASEAEKLLQYLVSQRWIDRNDTLPVYILAHPEATSAIRSACQDSASLVFEILDSHQQARRIGLKTLPDDSRSELLFLQLLRNEPPRQQFASTDHRHNYHITQIRHGLIALGAITLLASITFTSSGLIQTRAVRQEALGFQTLTAETDRQYRKITAAFPPIGIDYESLRRITTRHGELLAQQRLPDEAYRLISKALDQSPAIELEELDWRFGETANSAPGTQNSPPSRQVNAEVITLRGLLRLENGASMRQTLATLDQFVQLLGVDRKHTVQVLRQPFATESSQSLRGGDQEAENSKQRQFTLQVTRQRAQ
mgnify:CR=1 FL=1